MGTDHEHRVATHAEAEALIRSHDLVYVSPCYCRGPAKEGKEAWDYCGHAVETCMDFSEPKDEGDQVPFRVVEQAEALEIFDGWKKQGGFFRFMAGEGSICCCCACGCGWFRDKEGNRIKDSCGTSAFEEQTDLETCSLCGECVDICAYDARSIEGASLVVDRAACYGCSACEYGCPEGAVEMVGRG